MVRGGSPGVCGNLTGIRLFLAFVCDSRSDWSSMAGVRRLDACLMGVGDAMMSNWRLTVTCLELPLASLPRPYPKWRGKLGKGALSVGLRTVRKPSIAPGMDSPDS
jgi:hypothetical protein